MTAQRIFEQRTANGPFKTREQLKQVTGIGDAVFVQSAGFLKIVGGDQPLDSTWIHPESYGAAEAVLGKLGATPADLLDKERAAQLAQRIGELSIDTLAGELGLGVLTLRDIVAQLVRPGRDPRESLPPPIFKKGVLKIDDLAPNMELAGTVLNVVDFGAFVDIGLKDSGLVHISQLADRYIQSPHEVVSVGDVVNVWVLEVDKQRRRVSLTMIAPGTRRAPPARGKGHEGTETGESRPPRQQAPRGERRPAAAAGQTGSAPASRPPRKFDFVKSRPPARQKKGSFTSKPQAKPVVPLTEEMKLGKAPMRTFGDLAQFLNLKKKPDDDEPPPAKE